MIKYEVNKARGYQNVKYQKRIMKTKKKIPQSALDFQFIINQICAVFLQFRLFKSPLKPL